MNLDDLRLVTGSAEKLEEARRILGFPLRAVALDLPEVQELDIGRVLQAKLAEARQRLSGPLAVEESALELEGWNGFPGPLVKWMLRALGAEGLARVALAAGSGRALARCRILASDGERAWSGEGTVAGQLVLPPRGTNGFGWDPVFVPDGETRTFGELPAEVKDTIGHRGKAWRALLEALDPASRA